MLRLIKHCFNTVFKTKQDHILKAQCSPHDNYQHLSSSFCLCPSCRSATLLHTLPVIVFSQPQGLMPAIIVSAVHHLAPHRMSSQTFTGDCANFLSELTAIVYRCPALLLQEPRRKHLGSPYCCLKHRQVQHIINVQDCLICNEYGSQMDTRLCVGRILHCAK